MSMRRFVLITHFSAIFILVFVLVYVLLLVPRDPPTYEHVLVKLGVCPRGRLKICIVETERLGTADTDRRLAQSSLS